MPRLSPRPDDHHRNTARDRDTTTGPGHVMTGPLISRHRRPIYRADLLRAIKPAGYSCRSASHASPRAASPPSQLLRITASIALSSWPTRICRARRLPFHHPPPPPPHSIPIAAAPCGAA
jgi:hypothetical protein